MEPIRSAIRLAQTVSLLWLAGCTGVAVRTDFDRDVDFSGYRSFAWLAPPLRETPERAADPFTANSLLDKRVRRAVEQELERRGLPSAPEEQADLRVDYRLLYSEKLVTQGTRIGSIYRRGPAFYDDVDVHVSQVPEATLVLDLIDARSEQLVWRGWSTRRDHDRNLDENEIARAVAEILRRYPPPGSS